jgi:phosphate transport system substrate-binding protein
MSSSIKSSRLAVASLSVSTLAATLLVGGFTAQKALSIPPDLASQNQILTCTPADVGPCVLNGAGATFPFPFFQNYFPASFPDQVNYAGIGSGGGINAFLSQVPPASPPAAATVPSPFSFASTDAPVTQAQREVYYFGSDRVAGPVTNNPLVSPTIQSGRRELGYGPLVQVPSVAGGISVSYSVPGVADGVQLTRADECGLFNGTLTTFPGTTVPVTGVRRFDSSGTTFITSSHLNTVCSGLGLWSTPSGQSRGFGQVSVPDTDPACALPFTTVSPAPAGQRTNTVCWPTTFLSGSGNPGVAAQVRGVTAGTLTPPNPAGTVVTDTPAGEGRFGYVEFGVSVLFGPNARVPFTIPASLPPGDNGDDDIFLAAVENQAGAFVLPTSNQVTLALTGATDTDPRACTITVNEPDPAAGYPISGLNYFLFYGDYIPDVLPSGAAPTRAGAFNNQGALIRNRTRQFVSNLVGNVANRQIATDNGYAPLPNAGAGSLAATSASTALNCVQAVSGGTNPLDPTP